MTIKEIIQLGKQTTLGSYALKDDDEAIFMLLNFALIQVYSKIPALKQSQHLHLVKNKTRYEYLQGSYKVLSAVTDCGIPLDINNDLEEMSLYDMGNHVIDVPMCVQHNTDAIQMLIQMKPPTITCENYETVYFTPDDALVPAILSHMAYMVSKNISEDNGVGHLNEFNMSIDEVKRLGLFTAYQHSMDSKFYKNGWC